MADLMRHEAIVLCLLLLVSRSTSQIVFAAWSWDFCEENNCQCSRIEDRAFLMRGQVKCGAESKQPLTVSLVPSNDVTQFVYEDVPIKSLPAKILDAMATRLNSVSITGTQITTIDDQFFANTESISSLVLANNKISQLESASFSKLLELKSLDLSNNELTEFSADFFKSLSSSLEEVFLNHNQLISLPELTPNLIILSAGYNAISSIGALEAASLTDLNLSFNKLKMLPFFIAEGLPALERIDFTGNDLQSVCNKAFDNRPSILVGFYSNPGLASIDRCVRACKTRRKYRRCDCDSKVGCLDVSGRSITNSSSWTQPTLHFMMGCLLGFYMFI